MDVVRYKVVDPSLNVNILDTQPRLAMMTETLVNVYGVDKIYVDGSLALRDASIEDLYNQIVHPPQDPSISNLYETKQDLIAVS